MATAKLVLPDGTTVAIEGTAEEVAVLLSKISSPNAAASPETKSKEKTNRIAGGGPVGKQKKGSVSALITELAEEGYFKSKQSLGNVKNKLEERGHIYPVTTISPCLTRLTKSRVLRRLKENKIWVYVN